MPLFGDEPIHQAPGVPGTPAPYAPPPSSVMSVPYSATNADAAAGVVDPVTQAETYASAYGGSISSWQGMRLSGGTTPGDLAQLLNMATTFANAAGGKYFPSAQTVSDLLAQGAATWDQQKFFFNAWNGLPPDVRGQMIWLAYGMNQQQYTSQVESYKESLFGLTGSDDVSSLASGYLHDALAQGWSASRFQQAVQGDPHLQSQYGWLKHGMSYQQFQQFMVDNKPALESRYGRGNVNATTALNDLNNPLQAFGSYAPPISAQSPQSSPQTSYGMNRER